MTTLCYAKKTCSIGIHVLMEEIGSPYDLRIIDIFSQLSTRTHNIKRLTQKEKWRH